MRFDEFQPRHILHAGPYRVTKEEIVAFAGQYDPQWFHVDDVAAADGPFEGLIASGWHTCSIAMRLVAEQFLAGSESFASPGVEEIRWPEPVRPGDDLRLEVEVCETRRSRSRPELGILLWHWRLFNQSGQQVLDMTVTSMFKLATPLPSGV